MNSSDYLIHELADRAGVSIRTIRYYINEGLLPAPDARGRYATYPEEYLDRLRLIRRLKDAFLPLKEIREQVSGLSDAEVRELLRKLDGEEQKPPEPPLKKEAAAVDPPASSALDYISQLRATQQAIHEKPAGLTRQSPLPSAAQPAAAPGEVWQRIVLAPGVELHVREPDSRHRERIRQLIEFARHLFA